MPLRDQLQHPLEEDGVFELNMNSKVGFQVVQFWEFIITSLPTYLVEQCDEPPLILLHYTD